MYYASNQPLGLMLKKTIKTSPENYCIFLKVQTCHYQIKTKRFEIQK